MSETFRIQAGILHIGDRAFPHAEVRDSAASISRSRPTIWRTLGAHLTCSNGVVLSIQWGTGTYSDNYRADVADEFVRDACHAEIAMWYKDGDEGLLEWSSGDTVEGWVTPAAVLTLIDQTEPLAVPIPSVREDDGS